MKKKTMIIICIICGVLLIQSLFIGYRFSYGPFESLGQIRLKKIIGNSEEYSFSKIEELEDSPLKDKNVLFLGSSVTNGRAALYNSIPEYVSKRFNCGYQKEAVDGTTLTDTGKTSYVQRLLNNVDTNEKFDLVVVQLSTNDASKEKPLGEITDGEDLNLFDTSTITGAMEYIISYVKQTWDCPVVFYTNAKYDSDAYQKMVDRLYELKDKWNIGILDLWSDETFNNINDEQRSLYMYDSIHPTMAGYRDWWGPRLEKELINYLSEE